MKLSLNWIKDYVKLPDDLTMSQLAFDLTMSTVEVEGVHDLKKQFDGIVVGVINEVLPHPNADKLRVCKVDIGTEDIKEIVCGGSKSDRGNDSDCFPRKCRVCSRSFAGRGRCEGIFSLAP